MDLIAKHPLLRTLLPAVRDTLAARPIIDLPGGTPVFEASTSCKGFPVLLSGSVRVFKHLANGRRIELYRVTPAEPCILSLGCLLGGGQYPASGVSVDHTAMLIMPPPLFRECLAMNEAFRNEIFRVLGERLVHTIELVEEITTLRLDVRLAASLLTHAQAAGGDAATPGHIAITHQELADELGTVREIISRVLDDFAHQGMVVLGRGRIQIADAARLHQLASTR